MKLPNEMKNKIKSTFDQLEFSDKLGFTSLSTLITPKLREVKMNGFNFLGEELKLNNKYLLYYIYNYNVIVEGPPKYERKCRKGFLGIGKKCTNVEIRQNFTQNKMEEIHKEIKDKVIVDAFVDLPKVDYEKYKQILLFKFPQNKNLK